MTPSTSHLGLCAELLPEVASLDGWGFPVIADRALNGQLAEDARMVARICPKLALRLA